MADQNCAHSGCKCKVEQGKGVSKGGKTYCSDGCANAGSSASSKCQCKHPGYLAVRIADQQQVIANLVTVDSEQRLGNTLLQLARTLGQAAESETNPI